MKEHSVFFNETLTYFYDMKKMLAAIVLTFLLNTTFAQSNSKSYSEVDNFVTKLGSLDSFNVAIIADTLTRSFPDKHAKARAIFYWVANNISFDLKAMKSNDNRKVDPVLVIKTRKATALGYANLIQEMSSMANIRCLTVDGYVKNFASEINEPADEINHTWNVVQLGESPEQWFYVDAAKASGYTDSRYTKFTKEFTSEYFFADKILFNLDHYPDNGAWQLGPGPKKLKDFYSLPVFSNAAYVYGLQKSTPAGGFIKAKTKNAVTFSFPHKNNIPISSITLVTGEDKRQDKPLPMNFTSDGSNITFTHQFRKEDSYPVKILVDGKVLVEYLAEVEE